MPAQIIVVTIETKSAVRPSKKTSTKIGTIVIGTIYIPEGMNVLSATAIRKKNVTAQIINRNDFRLV